MKKLRKRFGALGLSAAMCLSSAVCIPGIDAAAEDSAAGEVTTITLYPRDANLSSGTVMGYRGDYFASLGFAVDVWAYSDEKTNAILASGDLPDVMYIPMENLDTMIQAGMLLNLDDYLDQMPYLQSYEPMETALNYVREYKSNGTGSVYALPLTVGPSMTEESYADSTERNAVKLRWDVYEEIGAPEITSMDDLLDVMEQMLAAHPEEEDGTACYGTVLNSGSDTSYFACMTMWYRMQGYHEMELPYLLESNMIEGTNASILTRDSQYYAGLKWYNEAYKRGLLDPDSINNDRATQKPKVDSGLAMIPSGYLPGWSPSYLEYLVPGTQVYYNSNSPYGDSNYVIGVNAKTENIDACLAFLDMLADPDAQLITSSGPDGEFWYSDEEGNAYFTDAALEYLNAGNLDFTGFTLSTGEELSLWNTPFIANTGADTSYGDGEGGKRCARNSAWKEKNEISTDNETFHQWQETTGYENWQEWLAAEGGTVESSDLDYVSTFESIPDDMMQLTIDAIQDKVTTASWKMVYAETEEEFEELWDQMVSDCEGLGAQEIIEWRLADIENAKQIRDSLEK